VSDLSTVRAIHAVVEGLVQGVGFRLGAVSMATDLGLQGWVRNLVGGDVEVWAQGSDAAAVDRFVDWLHRGPRSARVFRVTVTRRDPEPGLTDFAIRR
jgi:acylphosphatase